MSSSNASSPTLKIAVEGCGHGKLDATYELIQQLEKRNNYKVDLLLICGDYEALRNYQDLQCMEAPDKYKVLGDFHRYYTGEKSAPVLTIVIGGNHEASNYLWELYHGGWLAPNIYFLGHAGCVKVNGLRIAGASGIYNQKDYKKANYERVPYDTHALRSVFHIREFAIRKLSLMSSPQIFLSHDWPNEIVHHGDSAKLFHLKPSFVPSVKENSLGSPPLMELLRKLKPMWWFSAHMHVKFTATVNHSDGNTSETKTQAKASHQGTPKAKTTSAPASNVLPAVGTSQSAISGTSSRSEETKFLALDKCLPNRAFLEILDIPIPSTETQTSSTHTSSQPILSFDPEWLAITRALHPWFTTTNPSQLSRQQGSSVNNPRPFPNEHEALKMIEKEANWVSENVKRDEYGNILVDAWQTFERTAPGPEEGNGGKVTQPPYYPNPQTEVFCRMLGIENKINP